MSLCVFVLVFLSMCFMCKIRKNAKISNRFIENTRFVSFDMKFTSQGFENAC